MITFIPCTGILQPSLNNVTLKRVVKEVNNLQCTLHPVVLYHKTDGDLTICIISDDMSRDVSMVYEIQ